MSEGAPVPEATGGVDEIRPSAAAARAIRGLRLDIVTAEVASSLDPQLVFILLKGPSIARWLYPGLADRSYVDVDILIDPADLKRASACLVQMGFSTPVPELSLSRPRAGHEFARSSDGAAVDLHTHIEGIGLTPAQAWRVLSSRTESMSIAGHKVRILSEEARLVHIALHASNHGPANRQSLEDVARAASIVDLSLWQRAVTLAALLDAMPALVTGLRLSESGTHLAESLGLKEYVSDVEARLRSHSPPQDELSGALTWEWISTRGLLGRLSVIGQKLFPSPSWMRERHSVPPGVWPLLLSYPKRWWFLLRFGIRGWFLWRESQKASKH